MWITKEAVKKKDKSVANHGDKRQMTCLATTSAEGEELAHQVVVTGKTVKSLPNFGTHYTATVAGLNTKGKQSTCFILATMVPAVANIWSFCCTANHWSDDITSRAYVRDIAVPYFKKKINALRTIASLDDSPMPCKEFGVQICVIIVDCWYGWIDKGFKQWLSAKYPWLRLLFVPAACTPVAQPMDAGVIAKLKGFLRKLYGKWVIQLTIDQITRGVPHAEIKVPADVPTCKKNLFVWLSAAVDHLNANKSGVRHCWEATLLLRAWERSVQAEAMRKVKELFPKLAEADIATAHSVYDDATEEDTQAGQAGQPFTMAQGTDEDDWEELVSEPDDEPDDEAWE